MERKLRCSKIEFDKLINKLESIFPKTIRNINTDNGSVFFETIDFAGMLFLNFGRLILAKGIADRSKCRIVALDHSFDDKNRRLLDTLSIEKYEIGGNLRLRLVSKLKTYCFKLFSNSTKELLDYTSRGVLIGDLVYQTIIRRNGKNIYSIKKLESEFDYEMLEKAIFYTYVFDRYFKKNNPKYYLVGECSFVQAVIARMAAKHGALLVQYNSNYLCWLPYVNNVNYKFSFNDTFRHNVNDIFQKESERDFCAEADEYIKSVFKVRENASLTEEYAFKNKKIVSKEEALTEIGINNQYKNVIIMCHCFTDSTLCEGNSTFQDYYEWYEETLKIVSTIEKVNWIIRPHPASWTYNEEGIARGLFEKYRSDNMYWMGENYSSAMVPVIADVIITVSGSAGYEYACLGIPSIVLGNPFYYQYGYTYNVENLEHYKHLLNNIDSVKKLTEEQIAIAKKVFVIYSKEVYRQNDDDEFQKISSKATKDWYDGKKIYRIDSEYIRGVCKYLENNDIKDSYLYQYGANIGAK